MFDFDLKSILSHPIFIISVIGLLIAFIMYRRKKLDHFTGKVHRVVLYYSPECPHCHHFMGTWDKFMEFANENNEFPVSADKINCKEQRCKEIVGFPTVLLHKKNGETIQFNGKRTFDDLVNFVKSNC